MTLIDTRPNPFKLPAPTHTILDELESLGKKIKDFKEIAKEMGEFVTEKNKAYGNSFEECEKFLYMLFPVKIPIKHYGNILCIVRMFDKLKKIAADRDTFQENPFDDLVGIALRMSLNNKQSTGDLEQTEEFKKITDTVEEKEQEYGKIDQKIAVALEEIYPLGVEKEYYFDFLFVVHLLEKIFRFTSPQINTKSKLDAFKDLAGYSIIALRRIFLKTKN